MLDEKDAKILLLEEALQEEKRRSAEASKEASTPDSNSTLEEEHKRMKAMFNDLLRKSFEEGNKLSSLEEEYQDLVQAREKEIIARTKLGEELAGLKDVRALACFSLVLVFKGGEALLESS